MFSMVFLSLICFFFSLVYLYFNFCYGYFKRKNIPYIEEIVFPLGNTKDVLFGKKTFGKKVGEIYKKYNHLPAVGFFDFNQPFLVINHPELIKQCLIRDFASFHDRGFIVNEKIDILDGHLFALSGSKWRRLRVKLTPTFSSSKIKNMFPKFLELSNDFVKYLSQYDRQDVDMKELSERFLCDIIGVCVFGVECNCLKNKETEFYKFGRAATSPTLRKNLFKWFTIFARPLWEFFKVEKYDPKMTEFYIRLVTETIRYREENNIHFPDFMQMLIQLKNNPSLDERSQVEDEREISLSIEECAAQAFIFFIAGYETSSITMSHSIYELAKNPEIQKRAQQEIDEVFEKYPKLTYDALNEIPYLDFIINETLRQTPPLEFLKRIVTKPVDIKWGDEEKTIQLDTGVRIIIPLLGLHHDPKYFPDPERYDPERFTEENRSHRPNYVYLPFGEGPRNCLGARFGLLQTKVGLAFLLRNYNFKISPKTPLTLTYKPHSLLRMCCEPLHLTIEKRL